MLVELRVRDLGVIESVALDLGPGMTALTGETGAGKTLLVEALELLVGGRADPSLVRPGADEALVEGRFARRRRRGHPGACRSRPRAVAGLDRRPHGPGLGAGGGRGPTARAPRPALPAVACSTPQPNDGRWTPSPASTWSRWRRPGRTVGPCTTSSKRSAATTGPGHVRPTCCDTSCPRSTGPALADPHEDDTLADEEDRLAEASAHREAAAVALDAARPRRRAGTAVVDLLGSARAALDGRSPLSVLAQRLASLQADASDVASDLRHVVETWDDDPERLEAVRARRQLLRELSRKYGEGLAGVLAFADEARAAPARARRRPSNGPLRSSRTWPSPMPRWPGPRPPWARRRRAAPALAEPWRSGCEVWPCPTPGSR